MIIAAAEVSAAKVPELGGTTIVEVTGLPATLVFVTVSVVGRYSVLVRVEYWVRVAV
jgi:hypothetical protein